MTINDHANLRRAYLTTPFFFYMYPLVGGLLAKSQHPAVFGRQSLSLAAFNVTAIAIYAIAVFAIATARYRLVSLSCVVLILFTYAVPANNELQSLPWISVILPLIRVFAGLTVLTIAFWQFRTNRNTVQRPLFAIGVVFLALSTIDLAIMIITRHTPPHAVALVRNFRNQSRNLDELEKNNIILIGDSFVWGGGVRKEDAFGYVLQDALDSDVTSRKVYSLGVVGAGPPTYVRILRTIPDNIQASQIILCYYMNDMPMPERVSNKLRSVSLSLGTGAPTIRVLGDVFTTLVTSSADEYHSLVVESYRKDHPSFQRRWGQMENDLQQFVDLAHARSPNPPLLLILPIMVDFQNYPLNSAHDDLTELGRKLEYEVLDLLPLFTDRLGNGVPYRVSPNNNHFNSHVHTLVAEALSQQLADLKKNVNSTTPSGSQ